MGRPRQRGNQAGWADLMSSVGNITRTDAYQRIDDLVVRGIARWLHPDPWRDEQGKMQRPLASLCEPRRLERARPEFVISEITKSEMLAAAAMACAVARFGHNFAAAHRKRRVAPPSRTYSLPEIQKLQRAAANLPAEDFGERAYEKVQAWPSVGDTKAVRVGPR